MRIGYVKQNIPDNALGLMLYEWVLAALPVDQVEYESWRVDLVLDDLKVPYGQQHKLLSELSGGWLRIAMLATVWITEPDVLLLDEPTNHLDIEGQETLEHELIAHGASCLMVSHDRSFLVSGVPLVPKP